MDMTTTISTSERSIKKNPSKDSLDYDYEVFCLTAAGNLELDLYFPESVI